MIYNLPAISDMFTFFLGFFLGHFIVSTYQKHNYDIHGPDSNMVKKQIHFDSSTGKYYQLEPYVTFCPVSDGSP